VVASVRPEQLPLTDPMAHMLGTTSCLFFDMDVFGLSIIEQLPITVQPNEHNYRYLKTKKEKMGHTLEGIL